MFHIFEASFWQGVSPYRLTAPERATLTTLFWIALLICLLGVFFSGLPPLSMLSAILLVCCSLLPTYFWCRGRVQGLPVLPVYSLFFLPTFAAPLVFQHQDVMKYTSAEHFQITLKVSLFLLVSCATWLLVLKRRTSYPRALLQLDQKKASRFFLVVTILSTVFQILAAANSHLFLPYGFYTLTRGIIVGLNTLAVFVLAFYWGEGELSVKERGIYLICLLTSCMALGSSLLLIGLICTLLLSFVGYSLGARKFPVTAFFVLLTLISVLHIGKIKMREKYWIPRGSTHLTPIEYPQWYGEWITTGIQELMPDKRQSISAQHTTSTNRFAFINRASLLHIALLIQKRTSLDLPLLYGKTYAIIPGSLVPRILWPQKISPYAGTNRLSMHYGLQTPTSIHEYSIGWGLLNESYANFGLFGILLLAVLQGTLLATITAWTLSAPIFSFRALFAVVIMSFALQTEWTAAIYCSALFHATTALVVLSVVYMERKELKAQ